MLEREKKTLRFFFRYLFRPNLTFLIYFLLIAAFGLAKSDLMLLYLFFFPWIAIAILFFNLPLFYLIFNGINMTENCKMNHVLEHGTIHFLKEEMNAKQKIGGRAQESGFRVGGAPIKDKIPSAFERLIDELHKDRDAKVLSKYCGSNVYFLQALSFVILTITFIVFLVINLNILQVQIVLLANLLIYMLLRYPIGNYAQKKLTMSFDFTGANIINIQKVKEDGIFERSPMYYVETEIIKGQSI